EIAARVDASAAAEENRRVTSFSVIESRAAKRKGGARQLAKLLPKPRSAAALANTPDAFFLSALAKQIFRAGFVWKIVEYKSPDVVKALRRAKVVKRDATSKRDLRAVQEALNVWREQSGRPLCQLSRILACSVG